MKEQKILDRFCKRLVALDMDIFGAKDAAPIKKSPWITMNGTHIHVSEGETPKEAGQRFIAEKQKQTQRPRNLTTSQKLKAAEYPKKLTEEQDTVLTDYAGDPSINGYLRSGNITKHVKKELEILDSVFANASTTEPMTVFRGVGEAWGVAPWVKDLQAGKLKVGDLIHDEGYMSTSADMGTPKEAIQESMTPVMLKIDLPKGTKAISLHDISYAPEQNEILLNRGGNLKIERITKTDEFNGMNGFLVHVSLLTE